MTVRTTTRLRGWVFYDANCEFCTATANRFRHTLARRGFRLVPSGLWPELRLLTVDGHTFGGADAVLDLARRIWWARPMWALAQLPGMRRLARRVYRQIAAHRYCIAGECALPPHGQARALRKEAR
ncbi:MAG: thiol-disulfide oxidoreductase DCC family protein [Candidatus Acidiferrales bacterium]